MILIWTSQRQRKSLWTSGNQSQHPQCLNREGTQHQVLRDPGVWWPLLDHKHNGCPDEGSALSVLPEVAKEKFCCKEPPGELLQCSHQQSADLQHLRVVSTLISVLYPHSNVHTKHQLDAIMKQSSKLENINNQWWICTTHAVLSTKQGSAVLLDL